MATVRSLLIAALASIPLLAADKPSAKVAAGPDGKLDRTRAAAYLVIRDAVPISLLFGATDAAIEFREGSPPQSATPLATQLVFDTRKLVTALEDNLDDLRSRIGHDAPWTWQELDQALPPADKKPTPAPWQQIEGVTKAKEWVSADKTTKWSLGPIQLRKSADELGKKLSDAKGFALGYTDNRIGDQPGVWNSTGLAYLQLKIGSDLEVGPAAEWQLAQTNDKQKHDVEGVTYGLPLRAFFATSTTYSGLWAVQGKPYYQTDFSGGHQIRGLEASGEFVGRPFGTGFYVGAFQQISGTPWQYQFRVVPKLNYSMVKKAGRHSTRKLGDDWLRLGGLVSLDYRLGGESTPPLDFGLSYEFAGNLRSNGGHGDLLKANVTWWANDNVGFTIERSRGDTPIAAEKVDFLKLGFEFKY
jgi:hypothetical protein